MLIAEFHDFNYVRSVLATSYYFYTRTSNFTRNAHWKHFSLDFNEGLSFQCKKKKKVLHPVVTQLMQFVNVVLSISYCPHTVPRSILFATPYFENFESQGEGLCLNTTKRNSYPVVLEFNVRLNP